MRSEKNKLGFIARIDNTGLGTESLEFVEHMHPEVLAVKVATRMPQYEDRFPGATVVFARPSDQEIRQWLIEKEIGTLFMIETPYNPNVITIARELGVRTILRVNYEYLDPKIPRPDLYVSPSNWNFDRIPNPKILLPFPVCTDHVQFKQRETARTFVHIAGGGGYMGRNGTDLLLQAMPLIKEPIKLIVYSQKTMNTIKDPRIDWRIGNVKHYWDLYRDGDVMIYPRRHSGQSLPVNEAMAAGMPVLMTDMKPQNEILPKEWLIPVKRILTTEIKRQIEFADIDPAAIAAKVGEWYNQPIWQTSKSTTEKIRSISWEKLLPEYRTLFRG